MDYILLIKEIRIKRSMTQEELAEKAKIKQSYISQLESNAKSPTLRVVFRIAEALNVCPHVLVQYNVNCDKNCLNNCEQNFFSSSYTSLRHDVYTLDTPPCKIASWGDCMAGEKFTIYMEEQLKKDLKKAAIDENRSASEIISELVTDYLKKKQRL